jgi:hypothetical protein
VNPFCFEAPTSLTHPDQKDATKYIQTLISTTCGYAKGESFQATAVFPGAPQKLLYGSPASLNLLSFKSRRGENSILLDVLTCIDYQFSSSGDPPRRAWGAPIEMYENGRRLTGLGG